MKTLPDGLLERYRVLSLERVGRVEAAWTRLLAEGADDELVRGMLREVHTLKGDSSVVGQRDVQQLCQKFEDLLHAIDPDVEMSEDFELVVTMAIQFLGMLLRMRHGTASGVDLEGFVCQVDDVLREMRALPSVRARATHRPRSALADGAIDRLSEAARHRLGASATTVYLEYLAARGAASRSRLRTAWGQLRDEIARLESTELSPLLARHAGPARELAHGIGKRVAIELFADARVEPRVAEAIDIAVLHLVRNAVDHGIEDPATRARAGKREEGRVRVHALGGDGQLEIAVSDDGRGIDLAAVRATAIASGRLDAQRAAGDAELLDLVFAPGFSTRASVTQVSGRGVGLDAVKTAIARAGGTVRAETGAGGTTVTISVPALVRHLHAYQFLAPGGAVSLAVSARWAPEVDAGALAAALDPLRALQLLVSSHQTAVPPSSSPPRDLAFRLRWGFLEVGLRAASEPRLVTAERICPTPDEHPVEVVLVDGCETLLLRPESIGELAAAWSGRVIARAPTQPVA
ncbi:MAG: Hpt domain-containing protein [Deltaproteobacteria bacterium]|nr:Hpt domain-containing protein [Deltaproteobacteria bacterium]